MIFLMEIIGAIEPPSKIAKPIGRSKGLIDFNLDKNLTLIGLIGSGLTLIRVYC